MQRSRQYVVASPGRTGANFFTKDQVMQHSFKCLLISLLPLSQVGCTPSNHDAPTSAPSDSGRFWMTDHEVGAEHLYGAVTQSSLEEKVQWHLTLSCSPENLGVEIEAPTEHIMPVLLPGTLGRRADVSYRFGDDKPVSGLWQIDLRKRSVFLEGADAERFVAEMERNNQLTIRVNYAHRQFTIAGTRDVVHTMRRNCTVMNASMILASVPAS
jgi:hypothetical protein